MNANCPDKLTLLSIGLRSVTEATCPSQFTLVDVAKDFVYLGLVFLPISVLWAMMKVLVCGSRYVPPCPEYPLIVIRVDG